MTGDDVYTHQLGRVAKECAPEILRQHPQLANVDASDVTTDNWRGKLREWVKEFGANLPLAPLPMGAHLEIDPMKEAEAMVGEERIIVVRA